MNFIITPNTKKVELPKKGYFSKGDEGIEIEIISSFLAMNFLGFEYKTKVKVDDMLGMYFGKNLEKWIMEFQKNNNLVPDGCVGSLTLNKLKEYGFNEW